MMATKPKIANDGDVEEPATKPATKKPAGTALQAIFALLGDASAEAESGLEEALAGLEGAVTAYLSVMRLRGEEGASGEALTAARDRLGAVLEKLGGGVSAATGAPPVPRKYKVAGSAPVGGQSTVARAGGPRGEMAKRVHDFLSAQGSATAGTLIDRLQAKGNKPEESSIRNFLASGKRNGTLTYDETTKTYKLAAPAPA